MICEFERGKKKGSLSLLLNLNQQKNQEQAQQTLALEASAQDRSLPFSRMPVFQPCLPQPRQGSIRICFAGVSSLRYRTEQGKDRK